MKRIAFALLAVILLTLIACAKTKGKSGAQCSGKSDCADDLDCYVIGANITCQKKEEADALCKAGSNCKDKGWCTSSVKAGSMTKVVSHDRVASRACEPSMRFS